MNRLLYRGAPMAWGKWCGVLSLVVVLGFGAREAAASDVVRVEEDWEMVLLTPDPNSVGPQVTCVFSSQSDLEGLHAAFELNHRTSPEFKPGGMQLQLWEGESKLSFSDAPNTGLLNTPGETITWTQSMSLANGSLTFEILNGNSQTWGSFGGQGYLKRNSPTLLDNLNGYDPEVSVKHSGVGFAANRVQSLVLKRVRLVTADGQTLEDTTARTVHE